MGSAERKAGVITALQTAWHDASAVPPRDILPPLNHHTRLPPNTLPPSSLTSLPLSPHYFLPLRLPAATQAAEQPGDAAAAGEQQAEAAEELAAIRQHLDASLSSALCSLVEVLMNQVQAVGAEAGGRQAAISS